MEFSYPSRPETKVLNGLNLDVSKGLSVALVGPSGCGKSTVIQLLLRLYDPTSGNIYLDGDEISSLKIATLRHQLAIVSQVLYKEIQVNTKGSSAFKNCFSTLFKHFVQSTDVLILISTTML